jgi:signal transduction histidine kinase
MTTTPLVGDASSALAAAPADAPVVSLRYRLPIFICALLAALGVTFAAMARYEVERALRISGHERLTSAASQVVALLGQSSVARVTETDRLAADPAIVAIAAGGDATALASVPPSVRLIRTRSPQTAVSLYNAQGQQVAVLRPSSETWEVSSSPAAAPDLQPGLKPLHVENGRAEYRIVAAVPGDAPNKPRGYVAIDRPLAAPAAMTLIERLIGTGATLKLGNAAGDLWTDLSTPVAAPPAASIGAPARYVNAEGQARLGTRLAVVGTPWVLWAEVSERELLQPARTLLSRMIPITIALVAIGALAVYGVSRRMTMPIEELVTAAEGISAGEYSRRVNTTRRDEIGRLGRAFNIMAARVGDAHDLLEARVQARTAELENTMTALHDTQAALVRRERLAILGQLASSVGHELRNPLGVMTNAVYYLKMVHAEGNQEVREYLGILAHQIGLAERIVADLLDFARLKSPQWQALDASTLIEDQLARLEPESGVSIERRFATGLPPVRVDPVQIGQVLFNLFTNASQAMNGAGTLTISLQKRDDLIAIDVTDTGPGISAENLPKIFEPLFTTKARGIGLGLAVSHSLATNNGGTLTAVSPPGSGATFTLTLPIAGRTA